ncbi:response regulator [bacterium]|nr:response regulator [bacterium]
MGLNVLIVDDSSVMRSMVKKTIKMSGVPVTEFFQAENGKVGLDVLEREWVDVIFADINMPVMNGMEMIDNIRNNNEQKEIPIIVISTESSTTRIQEITEKGVHFIHKPFTPEKLREVINDILGDLAFRVQVSEKQLVKVAANVLETMAFAFLDTSDGKESDSTEFKSATVQYHGPFSGIVILAISNQALSEFAKNMLCQDDEDEVTQQQEDDALCELTNVVCGNLLSDLAGPEPVFNLDAPQILPGEETVSTVELSGDVTSTRLQLDNGWAELTVAIVNQDSVNRNEASEPDEDSF